MTQKELSQLLKSMSIEEKINQLLQLSGSVYEETGVITGPVAQMGFDQNNMPAGSVLGIVGADKLKKIQKEYIEKHPHRIPLLFMADIINGYKTIFPIPLALGCTFEPELAEVSAAIAAKESAVSGLHVTFSPMVDLVRDARWGRVMESTGEDTYLNCCFAKAFVAGYQGNNVMDKDKIAACVKHFAAYGAPTAGRDYNNVELSERTLRDDYLPVYQAAIEAGCALVMTSFNTLNRVPSSGNKKIMREILRGEMAFEGVLISDWAAIEEMVCHGMAENRKEAALRALEAGVDIDMMTPCYTGNLKNLLEEGSITEKLLDESAMRILQLKNKLGLFENPYKDADSKEEKRWLLCQEHRESARKIASKSFVLLENENILPLKKEGEKLAFIGPYVENKWIYGAWSIFAEEKDCVSIKEGIIKKIGVTPATFALGCDVLDEGQKIADFASHVESKMTYKERESHLKDAVEAAKTADKVILALGEHAAQSGEAASRAEIRIADGQMKLLERVYEVNKNIVVILFSGRPLDLREVKKYAKAILVVWFPGTEGGNAIADVLFGDFNPSGRLAMSFPYSVGQIPVHYNEFSTGRPYKETEGTRFGSKYLDIPNEPLYPFGYGLSYTSFEYSRVIIDNTKLSFGGYIKASVQVKNTGEYEGEETIQLYIQDVSASVVRPVRELKGFQKVLLKPGESREIVFGIEEMMLKFYNIDMNYCCEPGLFKVFIGGDSRTQNSAQFYYE